MIVWPASGMTTFEWSCGHMECGVEWIGNSTKVLFDLCPSSTCKLSPHMGAQIRLLVSHFLDELPPVTFNSFDVSCLLGRLSG